MPPAGPSAVIASYITAETRYSGKRAEANFPAGVVWPPDYWPL
jgi:hypothetical protein